MFLYATELHDLEIPCNEGLCFPLCTLQCPWTHLFAVHFRSNDITQYTCVFKRACSWNINQISATLHSKFLSSKLHTCSYMYTFVSSLLSIQSFLTHISNCYRFVVKRRVSGCLSSLHCWTVMKEKNSTALSKPIRCL